MFTLKNVFKKVAILVIALSMSEGVFSQLKGDFAAGITAPFGYNFSGSYYDFGFGAVIQYNVSDPIRLSGEFDMLWGINVTSSVYGIKSTMTWQEFSLYGHYLIATNRAVIYPLVGVGFVDMTAKVKALGITVSESFKRPLVTIGVGNTTPITDRLIANFEVRLKIVEEGTRVHAAVGIAYLF